LAQKPSKQSQEDYNLRIQKNQEECEKFFAKTKKIFPPPEKNSNLKKIYTFFFIVFFCTIKAKTKNIDLNE
jgi:hypothetical protein